MNDNELDKMIDSQISIIKKMVNSKGKEYSSETDVLANFKRHGEQLGLNPETVWSIYASKHYDSIISFVKSLEKNSIDEIEKSLSEPIEGRISDLITYLVLLKALIKDRRKNGSK